MARLARLSFLFFIPLITLSQSAITRLPAEVHPAFNRSLERADTALKSHDPFLAKALLDGILYPDGITVRLDRASLFADHDMVRRALARALNAWEIALGPDDPLRLTDNPKASIIISMVDKVREDQGDAAGLIQMEKKYSWSKSQSTTVNKVSISVVRSLGGTSLNEDECVEVIAHELGHLLGLADLEQTGSLMGPMQRGYPQLGPKPFEVSAVMALRRAAREREVLVQHALATPKT